MVVAQRSVVVHAADVDDCFALGELRSVARAHNVVRSELGQELEERDCERFVAVERAVVRANVLGAALSDRRRHLGVAERAKARRGCDERRSGSRERHRVELVLVLVVRASEEELKCCNRSSSATTNCALSYD